MEEHSDGLIRGGSGDGEVAGNGEDSQLDLGVGSWRQAGMLNLRLEQFLAWWSGRLQTMQTCNLGQFSLLQSSYQDQSSQI